MVTSLSLGTRCKPGNFELVAVPSLFIRGRTLASRTFGEAGTNGVVLEELHAEAGAETAPAARSVRVLLQDLKGGKLRSS